MEEVLFRLTKEEKKLLTSDDMAEIRTYAQYLAWRRKENKNQTEATKLATRLFSELNVVHQETAIRVIQALKESE